MFKSIGSFFADILKQVLVKVITLILIALLVIILIRVVTGIDLFGLF